MMRTLLAIVLAVATQLASAAMASDGGDWPMAAHDYASTRYSPLVDITPANAAQLRPAFTFSTGVVRGHEGRRW
jgi:glucose dehydrogenase